MIFNKIFLILALIFVPIIVFYAFSDKSSLKKANNATNSESVENKKISIPKDNMETIPNRYILYSTESLKIIDANNTLVLFFYASWCPTCIAADTSLAENADKIPENLKVIRVNYNDPSTSQDEENLAKKYGITYQHTFVQIDAEGNEIKKWNGGQIDELLENIR